MDTTTVQYMQSKVNAYKQLNDYQNNLEGCQNLLIKDKHIKITVDDIENNKRFIITDDIDDNDPDREYTKEEHGDLIREIKDDLIDAIGMATVRIQQKMEEL